MADLLSKRNAWLAILGVALISIPALFLTLNVELDHDFERFFSFSDPELERYNAFRDEFGNDNDFLFVCLQNEPSIFDHDFLLRADSLAKEFAALEEIRNVISPTSITEPRITPVGAFNIPWLRLDSDSTLSLDSARIWKDPRLVGNLFAETGRSMMIVLETSENLSKEKSDAVLKDVFAVLDETGTQDYRLAGRIFGQYHYIETMKKEIALFFVASVVLLILFLIVAFRSTWGVVVPVLVVALAILWQVALMTAVGKPLTIMTMLLPTILFIVGMSDAVHIVERYIESLRNGKGKREALAITYREVGQATFLTSLTTGIGFLTLLTSSIVPIQEFGVFTAIGVGIAFILAFALLPSILLLVKTPIITKNRKGEKFWNGLLSRCFLFVIRNQRAVLVSFALLTIGSIYLASELKVDNTLLEDLAEDDPLKADFRFFEEHYGGVRPFEMIIETEEGHSIWDLEVLKQIAIVQDHLTKEYGISNIISPVALVSSANKSMNGGVLEFYRLPGKQSVLDRMKKQSERMTDSGVRSIISKDGRRARLSGRMTDEGGYIHKMKNSRLESVIDEQTDPEVVDFSQTGMAFLIDRNNANLSKQLVTGLSIAFLLVSLIMAFSFRRWRMVLIALIPNVIPLLFLASFMYLIGIDLKVSTAIVFTIAFGIAVDDSIHILGKLRLELQKGRSIPMAMRRSYFSAGKAVIITSLMLVSGFFSLIFSDFGSVHYMGLLVSLTLLLAIIADLILLPVLVLWLLPKRK